MHKAQYWERVEWEGGNMQWGVLICDHCLSMNGDCYALTGDSGVPAWGVKIIMRNLNQIFIIFNIEK